MDETKRTDEAKPGIDAALIAIGLLLAALANALDIAPWAQIVLGVAAVVLLLSVFVRFVRKQS